MQKIKQLPVWGFYALLVYMPFHVFLVQSVSLVTLGLSAWKVAKDVAALLLVAVTVVLVWQQRKRTKLFNRFLVLALAYGLIHLAVWALNPDIYRNGALLGTVYNNRLLWYLLIGMGAALLWPKQLDSNKVIRVVLAISTLVCLLGLAQYYLPKDILTHVGYSLQRGVKPAFFIDDKTNLPRIMSTLRDPNSLGAFLILPITLLVYKLVYSARSRRSMILGILGLHSLALFLTFSRSAWLGTAISVSVLMIFYAKLALKKLVSQYWLVGVAVIVLLMGFTFLQRDQYAVQNVVNHSDENTTAQYDSNGYHLEYAKRGLRGMHDQPLGHGPGTAGLVSIQNPAGGFLTENYYLQLGYEVGIIGLALFVTVLAVVYMALSSRGSSLAIALIASFWGYLVVNLLLHTWSNEAVAVQWWLLAGAAIGLPLAVKTQKSIKKA